MKTIILSLSAILLSTCMLAQTTTSTPVERTIEENSKWTLLNEKEFEIKYPTSWTLDQSGQQGTKFVMLAPTVGEGLQFRTNVNLVVQDLKKQPMNLVEFTSYSINQITTMMPTSKVILNKQESRGTGLNYQRVIFTASQSGLALQFQQVYWIIDSQAYVLTFTTKEAEFKSYSDLRSKIFNSFMLH